MKKMIYLPLLLFFALPTVTSAKDIYDMLGECEPGTKNFWDKVEARVLGELLEERDAEQIKMFLDSIEQIDRLRKSKHLCIVDDDS